MGQAPGSDARRRIVAGSLAALLVGVLLVARFATDDRPQAPGAAADPPAADEAPRSAPVVRAVTPRPVELPDGILGGIRFVDVTERAGLADPGPATGAPTAADMDAGAAVADLDGDGDLDLVLTSAGGASGVYRLSGTTYDDDTDRSSLTGLESATTPAIADVDADGDLDLFIGGRDEQFGRLFLNDGTGRFTDGTDRSGIGPSGTGRGPHAIRGADFGDVDHDGDLDLVVTDWNIGSVIAVEAARGDASDRIVNQCQYAASARRLRAAGTLPVTGESRLFRNDGGRFLDVTEQWGLTDLGIERPFTPQLVDLDGDGWIDLAVAGDSCSSRLYRNDRGRRFVDVTAEARVGTDENGMGSLIRDLDGDGTPDWMVSSIDYDTEDGRCPPVSLFAGCSGNRVYLNRGGMRFEESTDELGLRHSGWGWGVVAGDFANDGRLQVAVTNGRIGPRDGDPNDQVDVYYDTFDHDPTAFFVRNGAGTYVDVAHQVGIGDDSVSHALLAFDHDGDGRLDLLVANAGAPPRLYRNVTRPRGAWTTIRLSDPVTPGNAAGIGARVEVTSSSGEVVTQWVHRNGSYEAQQPAEVHVGLGADSVRRVRVWWPGDTRPQVVPGPPTNRVVTIARES